MSDCTLAAMDEINDNDNEKTTASEMNGRKRCRTLIYSQIPSHTHFSSALNKNQMNQHVALNEYVP
jgi:hypothetical protein